MSQPPLLVVGPAWVGDMVMAQSLFIELRRQNPDQAIDVLAPGWCGGLLERMAQVRNAIELPSQHGKFDLPMRLRLGRELKAGGYERAIILPRSLKSALPAWLAGIPRRTGYLGEMRYGLINDIRPQHKPTWRQTVRRFLYLINDNAIDPDWTPARPALSSDVRRQTELVEQHGLARAAPMVALLPGAEYGPAKQWPPAHFARLARDLANQGVQSLVLGSAKEQALGDSIVAMSENAAVNLCGKTSLPDAIDLIAACDSAVSNDSGLMHVAAAVGVQVVGLYGSSSALRTPPLTDRAAVLTRDLACRPCFKRRCAYGHTACLRRIGSDDVMAALAEDPAAVVRTGTPD